MFADEVYPIIISSDEDEDDSSVELLSPAAFKASRKKAKAEVPSDVVFLKEDSTGKKAEPRKGQRRPRVKGQCDCEACRSVDEWWSKGGKDELRVVPIDWRARAHLFDTLDATSRPVSYRTQPKDGVVAVVLLRAKEPTQGATTKPATAPAPAAKSKKQKKTVALPGFLQPLNPSTAAGRGNNNPAGRATPDIGNGGNFPRGQPQNRRVGPLPPRRVATMAPPPRRVGPLPPRPGGPASTASSSGLRPLKRSKLK